MIDHYKAVVIGISAGGLAVLSGLLSGLPGNFPVPVIIVQHRARESGHLLEDILQQKTKLTLKQADEKEKIKNGVIYIAPPDYHLLVEDDLTFSLSADEYICYSRPSIDVLFETAANAYKDHLIGIILTGANSDGTAGIKAIYRNNGLTIAQDPEEAEYPEMPMSAIKTGKVKHVFTIQKILDFLIDNCLHPYEKSR